MFMGLALDQPNYVYFELEEEICMWINNGCFTHQTLFEFHLVEQFFYLSIENERQISAEKSRMIGNWWNHEIAMVKW